MVFGFFSCNKTLPSGFWKNYKKDFLKENINNQGPEGGHRAIHWKAEKSRTFDSKDILNFATKNGWKFVDSLEIKPEELETWNYNNTPIFPLSYAGFSSTPINNSLYKKFPRWISSRLKIYMFKTGWITIEPGTDDSNDVNGFVVLSDEGNEMSIYHLWGE